MNPSSAQQNSEAEGHILYSPQNNNHPSSEEENGAAMTQPPPQPVEEEDEDNDELSESAYSRLQLREAVVAINILDKMCFRRPIKVVKTSDFIDAIEEEKELAYKGLRLGYNVEPGDAEVLLKNAEKHGWAHYNHPNNNNKRQSPTLASGHNSGSKCFSLASSICTRDAEDVAHVLEELHPCEEEPNGDRETRATLEHDCLLYGEVTSRGTRQLYSLFSEAIQQSVELLQADPTGASKSDTLPTDADPVVSNEIKLRRIHKDGIVQVSMDVGCGTGKLLYEWSRLASADSTYYCPSSENPGSVNSSINYPRHTVGMSNASSVSAYTPRTNGERYSYMPYLAMTRSPCTSLPNSLVSSYNGSRAPYFGHPAQPEDGPAFPTAPAADNELPTLRGWLGIGVEVVPSRVYVTRQALAPYYLDLVPNEVLLVAERPRLKGKKSKRPSRSRGGNIRFDPAPPRAVACPHQDPSKRRPTACVLLYEGDALTPGFLHNNTLRRFPKVERTGYTPNTPSAAKDNYFRIARTENGVMLSGLEQVHLSVFCCGVGFGPSFTVPLCLKLEHLLRREEDAFYEEDTSEEEEDPPTPNFFEVESEGSSPGESPPSHSPPLVNNTFHNTSFNSYKLTQQLGGSHTGSLRKQPHYHQQPLSVTYHDSQHWRSVTCILLMNPSFEASGHLFQLPLFRCVQRNLLGDTPVVREAPAWLLSDGLADSYVKRVTVETSWMTETPAYLVHFSFYEKSLQRTNSTSAELNRSKNIEIGKKGNVFTTVRTNAAPAANDEEY
ncbi:hypothetical protein AGDE_16953 [Angomonas deanei]|nr:hypothetical protein AGDE_16953 [Angomonas deanei]|eukprot:EPY15822.1 hypothetical protein AGDE_16953 [Angomonas deanei]